MKIDRKIFDTVLLLLVFGLLFWWLISNIGEVGGFILKLLGILSPFILGLCFAFFFNIVMKPLEKLWLKTGPKKKGRNIWLRMKRPASIVLSMLIVFGVIIGIFFFVIPEFVDTVGSFIDKIDQYSHKIEAWWDRLIEFGAKFALNIPDLNLNPQKLIDTLTEFVSNGGRVFINTTIGITTSVLAAVVDTFLAIVVSIYILAQKERFGVSCKRMLLAVFSPGRVNSVLDFVSLVNRSYTSYVTGQLTEACIIGSLCFIGMLIFGMPYAPVVSVMVGFTALIPVFGAFFGTGVGAILILLENPIKAFWFIVFIIVLQQMENNLIYPKVVGKSVGLPAIFVLLAVTLGASIAGVVGMIMSVPTMSVIYTIINRWVDKSLRRRGIDERALR